MTSVLDLLRSGELTPTEHLEEVIKNIEKREKELNAFITLDIEGAFEKAKELDRMVEEGRIEGRLFGLVFAVKDNIAVKDMKLTCASGILKDYVSPYDATVVERIKKENAIIIGKTNLDEFACGSSGETSYFGPTKNPYDTERVPGGSSSGSAVAVAAGMADVSLGSDTGGSIRNPASFTGVYGFKPTYGLVSRYGLVDLAMSLDVIGPLSTSIDLIIETMDVINGPDGRDDTVKRKLNLKETINIDNIAVGFNEEFLHPAEEHVQRVTRSFIKELDKKGVEVVEIEFPPIENIWPLYYLIMYPEFASAMQRYNGLVYGSRKEEGGLYDTVAASRTEYLGKEVKRRIILGTYLSMEKYEKSFHELGVRLKRGLTYHMKQIFEQVDFIVTPTVPFLPFKLGERLDDPVKMYASDAYTVLANLTGIPAVNIPYSFVDGLPVGTQLMGSWYDDVRMLHFVRWFMDER